MKYLRVEEASHHDSNNFKSARTVSEQRARDRVEERNVDD